MANERLGEGNRIARKIAAIGALPMAVAVVAAGVGVADTVQPAADPAPTDSAQAQSQVTEPTTDTKIGAGVSAGSENTVVLAASSTPLGPAPLTAEQQQFVDNGQAAGTTVGATGGAAAAGAPAAAAGAVAGGAIGTAVAGPVGTIPGAVIGGVAAGAIAGYIGASVGSEVGGNVGAKVAEDQVRSENGDTPSDSGSFGDAVAGIPLLAP
ncbi:hypothetical protein [Smaragdicoccus niigatensis]|uniref:hypothetical protein n=1 Tax=Smaragdicoccus niigatensis TaxID=359359 RepID=UPI0003699B28|nr:hypothetical protein [Smaragdicoccus niigatensis]